MTPSETTALTANTAKVHGHLMHFLEVGAGDPIVFIHGNPTSSYLWRNVLPHVASCGRCIAVDLIGMGKSAKPPLDYRLQDHIQYVDGFLDALALNNITLVGHDWGVSLALHYLARFPERVRAVAFMEGHLHPIAHWDDLDAGAQAMFKQLRTLDVGRKMIIDDNFFIETVLPSGIQRTLSEPEIEAYREPFRDKSSREPLWRWPQEIPIEGFPPDVTQIVEAYQSALAESEIPKLLIHAQPGAVIGEQEVRWCRERLRGLTIIDIGPGIHFLPEDHPDAIGQAIARWLGTVNTPPV